MEFRDDDDDIMEGACVGHDYNINRKVTPKSNDSPSDAKPSEKKTTTTTTSISKETSNDKSLEKEKEKEKGLTPRKSPISLDLIEKTFGYLKLDYDVVDDLTKLKQTLLYLSCAR